jgi:Protein of unknown function (DUF3738)
MRAALALLASCIGFAQTPEAQFDAASIKPSSPIENGSFVGARGGPGTVDPGRYTCTYCYLSMVITEAYGVPYYRLSGQNRLPDMRVHIVATIPEGATREQFHKMLQNLLAERFQLMVHRETREMEFQHRSRYAGVDWVANAAWRDPVARAEAGTAQGASGVPGSGSRGEDAGEKLAAEPRRKLTYPDLGCPPQPTPRRPKEAQSSARGCF